MKMRGSNGTSLDEQPAEEITLEQKPVEELTLEQQDSEQQPARSMEAAQEDPDEQPTQEITLEQQSTSPMIVEQQPAQSMEAAQEDPDEQPTQEINQERQSTLQMVAEQQDSEQQPAQAMAVEQQNPQQESALPARKRLQQRPQMDLLLWMPLLIFLLLMIGVLIGRTTIEGWISHNFAHNQTPVVDLHHPSQSSLFDNVAKNFMDAMVRKDWATMWSVLSPDAQQLWHGEKDFIHFEQAKYGSLTFVSYNDSPAQMQYNWRDPDTTEIYPEVATLRISLKAIAPKGLLSEPSNIALSKGLFDNTLFAMALNHGNWQVLVAGPADLNAPILVPASPPAIKLLVPIFMYHHVSNLPTRNQLDYGLTVTTTNFDAQLTWFQQQGYHSITQTELFDALYYGKALPAHPMILTFDDGYEDMYTDALPALLAHHYRGVFYIITGMIGGRYMTWNQVRTLAQDGMQIASHTIHHVNVGQPPAWTSTQNELLLSKQMLETQLGQPIQFFCYPVGEPFHHDPVYEQQMVLADLYADGYVGATLDPFSFNSAIQNALIPYQLPRIRVSGGESMKLFVSILNYTLNIGAYRLAHGFAS